MTIETTHHTDNGTAELNGVAVTWEWKGTPDEGRVYLFFGVEGYPIATTWQLDHVMPSEVAELAGRRGAPAHAGWWIFDGFYQDQWESEPAGPFEALARKLLTEKLCYLRELDARENDG